MSIYDRFTLLFRTPYCGQEKVLSYRRHCAESTRWCLLVSTFDSNQYRCGSSQNWTANLFLIWLLPFLSAYIIIYCICSYSNCVCAFFLLCIKEPFYFHIYTNICISLVYIFVYLLCYNNIISSIVWITKNFISLIIGLYNLCIERLTQPCQQLRWRRPLELWFRKRVNLNNARKMPLFNRFG